MQKISPKYLFDTSLFIDLWRGCRYAPKIFLVSKEKNWNRYISVVTVFELWAGISKIKKPDAEVDHERMIADFSRMDITYKIAKDSGLLMNKHSIGSFDSLILGTAKYYQMHLLTSDQGIFNSARDEGLESTYYDKNKI